MTSLDTEEALSSLDIPLDPAGEDDEFHTENVSREDWERRNIIERTQNSIHIYCDLMEVTHGTLGQDDTDLATLMVFRFRFDPQKNSRRVYRARLKIEFFSEVKRSGTSSGPEVEAIAPEERWSLMPTIDPEQLVRSGEMNLGASGISALNAGASVKMEKTRTRDIRASTTVTGSRNLGTGRNSGAYTCAVWTLLENENRHSGVPDSLHVALLLKREDDEPFNANVTIEADADVATSFGRFFRKVPLDDPILFNPQAQPKHPKKGRFYGARNLNCVDLYSLCDAKMAAKAFWASEQE
ncbi:hypothetical protein F5X99DRAFT_367584 [Biscogniauxia marginata]|nr:hypothetical protein F5X99DRAFT_367584 [Biscogniauxia marginata]